MADDGSHRIRIQSIDVLRGLAAMSVIVWHWGHFGPGPHESWPFYSTLKFIYAHGDAAVSLFFSISGFIFFLLYTETIESGRTGGWKFFVLRFSRLYPLHFVTLIIAAILQMVYLSQHGHCLIFRCTVPLFLEQLILEPNWFSHKMSFNGPSWSISVEVALYFIFFWVARFRLLNTLTAATISVLCFATFDNSLLGHGAGAFFAGVVVASIAAKRSEALDAMAAVGAIIVMVVARSMFLKPDEAILLFVCAVVFPAIVAVCYIADRYLLVVTDRLEWLGNISYSCYLIHFPLQLLLLTSLPPLGIHVDYTSRLVFVGFFALVIGISLVSYFYFERPVMDALRRRMMRGPEPSAETQATAVASQST